jgi:hypothetical protein
MKSEAETSGCDIHDLLFKLSGEGVELEPMLNNSGDQWSLDINQPQKVRFLAVHGVPTHFFIFSPSPFPYECHLGVNNYDIGRGA